MFSRLLRVAVSSISLVVLFALSANAQTTYPKACPALYSDNQIVKIEATFTPEVLNGLLYSFNNYAAETAAGLDVKRYRAVAELKVNGVSYTGVEAKLRGTPEYTWGDKQKKMQLTFKGKASKLFNNEVKKISLDAPRYDASLMSERHATHFLRDMGLVASCVNHAELWINGAYYGIFANIENKDTYFLNRNYGESAGVLWGKL